MGLSDQKEGINAITSSEDRDTSSPADETSASPAKHPFSRIGLVYGRLVYRLRWFIIAFWVLALLAAAPFASQISSVLSGGGYSLSGSESVQANQIMIDKLHYPASVGIVVFQSSTTPVSDPAYQNELHTFVSRARALAHVTGVTLGQVGKDNRTTYVSVNVDLDADHGQQLVTSLSQILPQTPARTYLTGDVAVYNEFAQLGQTDIEQADSFALPIALVLLLMAFGSVVSAITPFLLVICALPTALAFIYLLAHFQLTNSSVLSVASVIGLGLSIDYSLLMTRRFREELLHRATTREAVAWTITTAGGAILFSGLAVIIGFMGLLLIGVQFMTTFGLSGAIVVAAAVLTALTLLPAIFSVLAGKINALRIPFLQRRPRTQLADGQGFWHRWATSLMRRPLLVVIVTSALILLLGWPIFSLKIGIPGYTSLPPGALTRQGLTILQQQIPAVQTSPIYIVAQSTDGTSVMSANNLNYVSNLTRWVAAQKHITSVVGLMALPGVSLTQEQLSALYASGAYTQQTALASVVPQFASGNTTVLIATSDTRLDSDAGNALIDQLRTWNATKGQGLHILVGGAQAVTLDINRYIYSNFIRAILFIVVATYILLLIVFRSLLLPLKAVIMNLLSIGVAYGILVYVFQWGNLANILNFQSEGFIESTIPIILFCVLFGLSMDYEVFLLSRVHEEWLKTHNNRQAVALGLEKTAGVITSAALILVVVAGAITFTSLISTKEIGLGVTTAILADATIIRLLLVPATMRLLGRWNWWLPGRPLPTEAHE
jgi:RND superfamily putative drug exporter